MRGVIVSHTQSARTDQRKRVRWSRLLLFLLSLGILVFLCGPSLSRIQILSPAPQGSGRGAGGSAAPLEKPTAPPSFCVPTDITCILTNVSAAIASGIQSVFQPISDAILTNPADIVDQTPLLTGNNAAADSAITNLNGFFVQVVDIAFACLLLIAGYNVIVGRYLLLP